MKALRRGVFGMVALALLLAGVQAHAQALKQLPANPWVIIKVNNPQAVSQQIGALMQKLELAGMEPALADPLGALKKQMGLAKGLNDAGDFVVAIYPGANLEDEPKALVLIPVTDYQAFLGNMANVKADGDVSVFSLQGDDQQFFSVSRGGYAVMAMDKEMLAPPAGAEVSALAAKQLDAGDVVAYINMPAVSKMVVPMFQQQRQVAMQEMEQNVINAPGFDKRFAPAMKVLTKQALDVVEGFLATSQSGIIAVDLSDQGLGVATFTEFAPDSYAGRLISGYKGGGNLLAGLPDRKYIAYGGFAVDSATLNKAIGDFLDPVIAELGQAGDEGKMIVSVINTARGAIGSVKGISEGIIPPAGLGQGGMQQVTVYRGNATEIAGVMKQVMEAMQGVMKGMPQNEGVKASMTLAPAAKTVDGVSLDQYTMKFEFDPNNPDAAGGAMAMQMLMGGTDVVGYMGQVDPETYIMVTGGTDEVLAAAIAAAKAKANPVGESPAVKAVAAAMPQNPVMVYYVAIDNIIGMAAPMMGPAGAAFQLPPGTPPIAMSIGTQDSTLRFDLLLPMPLIESLGKAASGAMRGGPAGGGPGPM